MNKILVVEDEESISRLITTSLSKSGYLCKSVFDGESASHIIERESFDLVLLDIMLPKISGFELLPYIKEFSTPVIFITAKSDIKDRVKGLKGGADDYIVKPFDIAELLARVETVLRRYNKTDRYIKFNDITVDTISRTVEKNGIPIDLTLKEFEMLLLFIRNKGTALYRETIYERVWDDPYMGDTRTVDLHVQRLRKKLDLSKQIQSVYKIGYRFCLEEQ